MINYCMLIYKCASGIQNTSLCVFIYTVHMLRMCPLFIITIFLIWSVSYVCSIYTLHILWNYYSYHYHYNFFFPDLNISFNSHQKDWWELTPNAILMGVKCWWLWHFSLGLNFPLNNKYFFFCKMMSIPTQPPPHGVEVMKANFCVKIWTSLSFLSKRFFRIALHLYGGGDWQTWLFCSDQKISWNS